MTDLQKLIKYTQNVLKINGINDNLAQTETYDDYLSAINHVFVHDPDALWYILDGFARLNERSTDRIITHRD